MNKYKYLSIFFLLVLFSCTQFLEEDAGENVYVGDDGCVYCHTNAGRLQALAVAEEGSAAGGG